MKKLFGNILDFFLSLRTAIWLTLALLLFLLFGSFVMPMREEFQALHTIPLFPWLEEAPLSITWWLWAAIGVLCLLTANTLLCSVESVIKKRGARHWLLILSPQVIHAGFLFILLAHLLSSAGGFRGMTVAGKGAALGLPNGLTIRIEEINAVVGQQGYIDDWSVGVKYYNQDREVGSDVIRPNAPSFYEGLGVYVKTVQMMPAPSAVMEVSREPGAVWALAGGILFLVGMTTLLMLKISREEEQG